MNVPEEHDDPPHEYEPTWCARCAAIQEARAMVAAVNAYNRSGGLRESDLGWS